MQTLLYWFAKSIVVCLQALPIELVARVGRAGGALAHLLDARHRRVTRQNLRAAFPEKNESEIRALSREHFRRLGENYGCAIKTASLTLEQLLTRVEVIGLQKLAAAEGDRRSRIVGIGHFGNFEIYPILGRLTPGWQGATTYRALRQPGLNRLLEELRAKSTCLTFERRTGARDLIRALSNGGIILGLLSDQHGGPKGVWGPFLGRECSTNPAPAVFALRYNSPLNTAIVYRVGLARWRIEVGDEIPLEEHGQPRTIEDITADVNRALEVAIRRDPANWFWVHKRWKPRQ